MVDELSHGERCVCELRELVDADLSTVSKHLSILKNAGIVEYDKREVQVFYRLKVLSLYSEFLQLCRGRSRKPGARGRIGRLALTRRSGNPTTIRKYSGLAAFRVG